MECNTTSNGRFPMQQCILCNREFVNENFPSEREIQDILNVCSKYIIHEFLEGSNKYGKCLPMCAYCISNAVELVGMNEQLERILNEISKFVEVFTKTIILHRSTSAKTKHQVSSCDVDGQLSVVDIKLEKESLEVEVKEEGVETCSYSDDGIDTNDALLSDVSEDYTSETNKNVFEDKPFSIILKRLQFNSEGCLKRNGRVTQIQKVACIKRRRLQFKSPSSDAGKTSSNDGTPKGLNDGDNAICVSDVKIFNDYDKDISSPLKPKHKLKKRTLKSAPRKIKKNNNERERLRRKIKKVTTKEDITHLENPLECQFCKRQFSSAHNRIEHEHNKVCVLKPAEKMVCESCEESFESLYDFEIHKMNHAGEIPFKCHHCQMLFSNVNSYAKHQIESSCPVHTSNDGNDGSSSQFKCEICEETFKARYLLLTHSATHAKPATGYMCTVCGKYRCRTLFRIMGHVISQHCPEACPLCCDICGKPIKNAGPLGQHRLTHKGDSVFLCTQCGKSYPTQAGLRSHILRSHKSEGQLFKCEHCGRKFKVKSDFKRHVRNHSKSIICDVCGKAFNRNIDLKTHSRIHTDSLFPCKTCGKKYFTQYVLQQHISSVHFGNKRKRGKPRMSQLSESE